MSPTSRPALRPVESVVVPDAEHGRVLVLRDTQGITDAHAMIPPTLVPIVARFTGELTCAAIAKAASKELGEDVPVAAVVSLAAQLDKALFLASDTFERAREKVEHDFRAATVRPPSHAGGAYHADATELRAYVERSCFARARARQPKPAEPRVPRPHLVGLIAPHIDPWRGAVGYGHAYTALADSLSDDADTFILFGTSHAPMKEPFALCRKSFDTPLGAMEADLEAIDALAATARFDPYADELNHKREHSLEFQAVFLRHVLGTRRARIVPILAGLGRHQARGTNPASDPTATAFLESIRELVASRPGRVVLVAGADLAHVGPRFGDARPYGVAERDALAKADHASLDRALSRDAADFWSDVARDLDTRRVCGLAPIYSLLQTLPGAASSPSSITSRQPREASLLHYEQTVDPNEGSIVSHAAVAFYA